MIVTMFCEHALTSMRLLLASPREQGAYRNGAASLRAGVKLKARATLPEGRVLRRQRLDESAVGSSTYFGIGQNGARRRTL